MQQLSIEISNDDKSTRKFNLITVNDNFDIVLGNIVVKNPDKLKEIRDALIVESKLNYDISDIIKNTKTEEFGLGNLKKDNSIIKCLKYQLERDGSLTYTERTYTSLNINIILLFTSLLEQELNSESYKGIGKKFVENDIFSYKPLNEIWELCRNNMLESKNINDEFSELNLFQATLKEGIIEYQINRTYSLKEATHNKKLMNLNLRMEPLNNNTKALGLKPSRR